MPAEIALLPSPASPSCYDTLPLFDGDSSFDPVEESGCGDTQLEILLEQERVRRSRCDRRELAAWGMGIAPFQLTRPRSRPHASAVASTTRPETAVQRSCPSSLQTPQAENTRHVSPSARRHELKEINVFQKIKMDERHMAERLASKTNTSRRSSRFSRTDQTPTTSRVVREVAQPATKHIQAENQVPKAEKHVMPQTTQTNSIVLPTMSNITELVSGIRKDSTTTSTKDNKSQSRFASSSRHSSSAARQPSLENYVKPQDAPLPRDDKAIYASLQMLRDRLEQLETEKATAAKREEAYQHEISEVRSLLIEHHGVLGDLTGDTRELIIALKNENAEVRSQLAELQGTMKDLTGNTLQIIVSLKKENAEVRKQLAELRGALGDTTGDTHQLLASLKQENAELRELISQSSGIDRASNASSYVVSATAEAEANEAQSTTELDFSQSFGNTRTQKPLPTLQVPRTRTSAPAQPVGNTRKQNPQPQPPRPRSPTPAQYVTAVENNTEDLTWMSRQASQQAMEIRQSLEESLRTGSLQGKRVLKHGGHKTHIHLTTRPKEPSNPSEKQLSNRGLRKSLLKAAEEMSAARETRHHKSSTTVVAANDDTDTKLSVVSDLSKDLSTVIRKSPESTETSMQTVEEPDITATSNTSRRRRAAERTEGMTSAFIMPDITITGATDSSKAGAVYPVQPDSAYESEASEVDATNATIRPSEPPDVALGKVIKALEEEITMRKNALARKQQLYHNHNPAVSKRSRMDTKMWMDRLTADIEMRSNQVYALHDVVLGQQKANKMMTPEDVSYTIDSLGIQPTSYIRKVNPKYNR